MSSTTPQGASPPLDGTAVVYCQGAFNTPNGKTAHGLVRRTRRYRVAAVIDRAYAGRDAGEVLDGRPAGIPVVKDLGAACAAAKASGAEATHFVVGLAPDGGRLGPTARQAVLQAIRRGLHVVAGLHDFLSEDAEVTALAAEHGVTVHDVRKPPHRNELHFFDGGKLAEVEALRIALLGTDSAVGKRTTAWILVDALTAAGHPAELIGTGQTAWMQGARFGIVLDSLVNDFISGEIEHAIWRCWKETRPQAIVLEGQGSLLNPAYPGGFELLAAGRPHVVILQHAPGRKYYDGFPDQPMHSLKRQVEAVQLISEKPVVAVTINHEGLTRDRIREACRRSSDEAGVPALDVLHDGPAELVDIVRRHLGA